MPFIKKPELTKEQLDQIAKDKLAIKKLAIIEESNRKRLVLKKRIDTGTKIRILCYAFEAGNVPSKNIRKTTPKLKAININKVFGYNKLKELTKNTGIIIALCPHRIAKRYNLQYSPTYLFIKNSAVIRIIVGKSIGEFEKVLKDLRWI